VTSRSGVEDIVRQYHGERLVCYGLNPRPAILTKADGRLRSAGEADIRFCQNTVLDLDLEGAVTSARLDALKRFLRVADEYFDSLGYQRPVRVSTGRGSHLLFAFPPIHTEHCPGLRDALRLFRNRFHAAVRHDLSHLEVRLDTTQDLRRVVRVYGTAKPDVGIVSRFYGKERVEDEALREVLLASAGSTQSTPPPISVEIAAALPSWFSDLLATNERLRRLWHGEGKTTGDRTSSGYDYSLACSLIRRGKDDPNELGTILSLRPGGHAPQRGPEYLNRTITNALRSTKPPVST
jgi:hypothetical protein